MLQQTRIAAAMDHYNRFMEQLPTVQDLADCPEEKLLKLWEGLGYYSRARNLQKAAKVMVEQYGGELPADYKALLSLPGIGEYTAGAIASISFGLPVAAVDGNVLRVFARLYDDHRDILRPDTKKAFTQRVLDCMPKDRPGDFNEALMDLGAMVCVPNGAPQCLACPLAEICQGFEKGTAIELPVKTPQKPKSTANDSAFGANPRGKIFTGKAARRRVACRALAALVARRCSYNGTGKTVFAKQGAGSVFL